MDGGIVMQFMNSIKGGKQTSVIGQNSKGKIDRSNFLDSGARENRGATALWWGVGVW